jgi:hypothetical protein
MGPTSFGAVLKNGSLRLLPICMGFIISILYDAKILDKRGGVAFDIGVEEIYGHCIK